jgi:hypothetical protein
MRKIIFILVMSAVAMVARAQVTPTPNIGLEIPAAGSQNWNLPLNYNFNLLDLLLGGVNPLPHGLTAPYWNVTTGYQINGSYGTSGYVLTSTGSGSTWAINPSAGMTQLTGDVLAGPGGGSQAASVVQVHGVTYGATPAVNTVAVVTGSNTTTYEAVPNAALAHASITINSTPCTLGSTCTVSGSSPLTTKGDLWGFSTVDARIPVGADGASLLADSTQALGVRWGTPTSSGVQYNPTSTTYTFTGSSILGDDGHILGSTITVTGGSASGGVCTVTNSGTNGLAAGDWIYTGAITGWPAQGVAYGVYTYGSGTVNDDQFQVLSSGLSSSGFQFNCPNAGSATFTGGSAYPSNFWVTHLAEKTPFFNGHGTVSAIFDSTHTCTGINTNFSTLFPNVSGPALHYFILSDCHNEFNTGVTAPSTETIINSIMAKAHTAGYLFALGTTPNAQIAALNNGSYSFALNTVDRWSYTQGKSAANASSGQYADYLIDFNASLSDYQLYGGNQASIGSPGGNPVAAAVLNEALSTQSWSPKTQIPFCYFGWYTGVLANASGPGFVCSPSSSIDAFVVTSADQSVIGLHVDTSGATPGTRSPNVTASTALFDTALGSSTSPVCTTTNGQFTNSGCAGMTSISSPDASININTPAGTPTLKLSVDKAYSWNNTNTFIAPTTTAPATVLQATGVTRPTIRQSASGYNGSVTWTTVAGDGIVAFCQNSGSVGSTSSGDTFHVIQNTSTMTLSYAFNIAGGSGVTVGCAGGTGFIVYELASVPTTAFLDVSSATTVTSSPQTISLTTTQSNELLLSGIIAYFTGLGTQSVNGTWTNGLGGLQGEAVAFQNTTLAGAPGTYGVTWTYSGGTYNVILSAAFEGVTAAQTGEIAQINNASGTEIAAINKVGQYVPPTAAGTPGNTPANGGAIQNDSTANCAKIYTGGAWGCVVTNTGIVSQDTSTPITVSTTACTGSYNNQNATAGTAVTYNLPTAAACSNGVPKQFCFTNSYNGSAANTGVLTIATSASGQFIIFTDGTLSATGGNVTSGGAASDAACVIEVDSTHWQLYVNRGTWTKH